MSDPQFVEIFTANDDQPEVARKLLEAAKAAPEQVATVFGGFRVPIEVAEAAGYAPSGDGSVDAATVEGQALTNTAVAQRPAPASGVHATDGAQTGGVLAEVGNEPAGGATHEEATTGAPTEADVPQEDPNHGALTGEPAPVDPPRTEQLTGGPTPGDTTEADVAADRVATDVDADDDGEDGELRGEALDEALRSAGLSTSGKAADKRARLAAHRAQAQ